MPTRALHTDHDREEWQAIIGKITLPVTVSVVKGAKRSLSQNALVHKWYAEIALQLGDTTAETVRATCKLEHGVPILRRDDEQWREWYDNSFREFPYWQKIDLFERLDPAITRKMRVAQMTEYMDSIQRRYSQAGVTLSDPEGGA